jgi:hypothetical protein
MSDRISNDQQQVTELEYELLDASLKADFSRLNQILADNFIFTDENGFNLTKAGWVEGIQSGRVIFEAAKINDIDVQVTRNIAIVNAELQVKINTSFVGYDGRFKTMDIYEKREGRWQAILSTANQLKDQAEQSPSLYNGFTSSFTEAIG